MEQSVMNLESVKILLHVVITLTICQCTQSHHTYTLENLTYLNFADANDNRDFTWDPSSNYEKEEATRIAGGQYAKIGDFPYMAVVHQLLGNGMIGQCGGTILSNRWVLTAAHCAEKYPRRFLVVFGLIDKSGIQYDFNQGPGVSMIVTQAFVHPYYRKSQNDIALLYMPRDIPFSNTIQPINLLSQDSESFVNKNAFVIGWGKDNMASRGTTRLKYALLPIIRNAECKQFWDDVSMKHVCTTQGLGRDACQGDSGGPLVVTKNGIDFQIGIVSYGDVFCPSNLPGVFTRVSSYIYWIYEIMKHH